MGISIKKSIKKFVPASVWDWFHYRRLALMENPIIDTYQTRYDNTISNLRNKKSIRVFFFAIYHSNWKYDSLFQLMLEDDYFDPIVLICPSIVRDRNHELESRQQCIDFFTEKQYPFVCAYDDKKNTYLNPHTLNADIIFFTNPYKGLVHPDYYIDRFTDALTCYVSYGFCNVKYRWSVASMFHQCLWRFYVECNENMKQIRQLASNNGMNCRVVGYPMYDTLVANLHTHGGGLWKSDDENLKRIIWAPHHTVSNHLELLQLSTFEKYADFMWHLAEKYKSSVQLVFKPHPLLKANLTNLPSWGKEKTEAYYNKWANGENTALSDGEYVDLFLSSDAMIHDCGSFIIEYLYTKKPVMYLVGHDRNEQSNEIGNLAYDVHYHATSESEIESFVENVVLRNNDTMLSLRERFFNEHLVPPNGKSVAQNIIDDIKQSLTL